MYEFNIIRQRNIMSVIGMELNLLFLLRAYSLCTIYAQLSSDLHLYKVCNLLYSIKSNTSSFYLSESKIRMTIVSPPVIYAGLFCQTVLLFPRTAIDDTVAWLQVWQHNDQLGYKYWITFNFISLFFIP